MSLASERPPDEQGAHGVAWNVTDTLPGTVDQAATVGAWLVHLPASHPYWPTYLFCCAHLRDIEGQSKPPFKKYPEAEYEFLIAALDPDGRGRHPLAVEDRESWVPLHPLNVVVQFDCGDDERAREVLFLSVRSALVGYMGVEPDDDARVRPWWEQAIRNTADHTRGAHE